MSPAAEAVGWEFRDDEEWLTGQSRKLLLAMAAGAGHEGIIAEGKKKFEAWKAGDRDAIHKDLRSVVFNMAIANGGKSEYETVLDEYKTSGKASKRFELRVSATFARIAPEC